MKRTPVYLKVATPEGPREVSISDIRPYYLYDTVTLTGTPASLPAESFWFQDPSNKTLVQTNISQFSTIQVGWLFEILTIRIIPQPSIRVADAETIFEQSVTTFVREGDVEVFTLPSVMLNAGCGIDGATTVTNTDIVSLGTPASYAAHRLSLPVYLYGGETFFFRIQFDNSGTNLTVNTMRLKMVLDGVLKRGVRGG